MKNSTGAAVTIHGIAEGQAEALEFIVDADTANQGVPLRNIHTRHGALIVCITHGSRTEIPNGNSVFTKGDSVIVVVKGGMTLQTLNELFVRGGYEL